jgi:glucan 1,3-beta-glucosidase
MTYSGPGAWWPGNTQTNHAGPPTSSPHYTSAAAPPWPYGRSSSSSSNSTSTPTVSASLNSTSSSTTPTASPTQCAYWLEDLKHQGKAPSQNDTTYQVFRNVKDYGAVGDGITDDTIAINLAISDGDRCAPGNCSSSTRTPATVYFPAGIYLISSSIIDYYYTNLIGNPKCIPTLKATTNFTGLGLIDGDLYGANGLSYGATNVFWRQVRNLIIDMTAIPYNSTATGIHWPTAQATSLQNIVFNMSDTNGTMHQGILIESGSGGFVTDLVFYGGLYGGNFGNQQFTMRNLSFYNSVTAINQLWDWGWTYYGININNCSVGLNMSTGGTTAQSVGSVTFFDSTITNTAIGILTAHNSTSQPPTAGSLILENVRLSNVSVAVQGPTGTALAGTTGAMIITAWGEGHAYTPTGPNEFKGSVAPNNRPGSLLSGGNFYTRSKPQYEASNATQFLSARDQGAVGNGLTDDTAAVQSLIIEAAATGQIAFFDAGVYKVSATIYVPANTRITGESYPVILGFGGWFEDIKTPRPIMEIGHDGEVGNIEWSDMIISTQGPAAGAILIEWNLATWGIPSGMWDVHTRIGGFAGSNLQLAQCPTTQTIATPPATVNPGCIAAFLTMHITPSAKGLYMENVWLWTADHDVEDVNLTQITIYAGRGLLIESGAGTLWLVGTAVEHHTLYQYQLLNTRDIFMGQIQTETAYYQPDPPAVMPFAATAAYNDPIFSASCFSPTVFNFTNNTSYTNECDGFGLRIVSSEDILVYGAGLYSFFDNYNTSCSAAGNGEACQSSIFSIEGDSSGIEVYNLNTIGAQSMVDRNGTSLASYADNLDDFSDTIAVFRTD